MRDNGLVPAQPKLSKKELAKLQREWYSKLEAADFKDIEWQENPDSPHIKSPASRGRKYDESKMLYYSLARNYLTHFRFRHMHEKTSWAMHTDGRPYREILDHLKSEYGINKSVYWVYYFVAEIAKKCLKWNQENPEGCLYGETSEASEWGMQLDQGFWQNFKP